MDGDTGQIAWTPSSQRLVAVAAASVGSFLVIFVFLIYRITNEIILARRCIMWARIALLGVVICHAIQLNMDLTVVPRVVLPQLGLVRPVAGGILCFLGFFVSSHPIFRWLVVLLQPLFIISDIYTVSAVQVQVSCREAGTCLVRTGYTLQQLRLLENRNYAAVFFEVRRRGHGGGERSVTSASTRSLLPSLSLCVFAAVVHARRSISAHMHGRMLQPLPCAPLLHHQAAQSDPRGEASRQCVAIARATSAARSHARRLRPPITPAAAPFHAQRRHSIGRWSLRLGPA